MDIDITGHTIPLLFRKLSVAQAAVGSALAVGVAVAFAMSDIRRQPMDASSERYTSRNEDAYLARSEHAVYEATPPHPPSAPSRSMDSIEAPSEPSPNSKPVLGPLPPLPADDELLPESDSVLAAPLVPSVRKHATTMLLSSINGAVQRGNIKQVRLFHKLAQAHAAEQLLTAVDLEALGFIRNCMEDATDVSAREDALEFLDLESETHFSETLRLACE